MWKEENQGLLTRKKERQKIFPSPTPPVLDSKLDDFFPQCAPTRIKKKPPRSEKKFGLEVETMHWVSDLGSTGPVRFLQSAKEGEIRAEHARSTPSAILRKGNRKRGQG